MRETELMIQKENIPTGRLPCTLKPFISLTVSLKGSSLDKMMCRGPVRGLGGVKALAAKPEGLSLIPGTQMLEDN